MASCCLDLFFHCNEDNKIEGNEEKEGRTVDGRRRQKMQGWRVRMERIIQRMRDRDTVRRRDGMLMGEELGE